MQYLESKFQFMPPPPPPNRDYNDKLTMIMITPQYLQCICHTPFPRHTYFNDVNYRETSNISRNLLGITIVDHSDVVGASPAGAAPTTS